MKQIHDWCAAHGLKFTGHLVLEESFESQLVSNGACMPHYEYFDIPGMDWLGLVLISFVLPAVLTWLIAVPLRRWGWIREGDLKLDL